MIFCFRGAHDHVRMLLSSDCLTCKRGSAELFASGGHRGRTQHHQVSRNIHQQPHLALPYAAAGQIWACRAARDQKGVVPGTCP